jgi:hypothetical protein
MRPGGLSVRAVRGDARGAGRAIVRGGPRMPQEAPCSGSIFEAAGGWFGQVKWMRTKGAFFDISDWESEPFTAEQLLCARPAPPRP